MESDKIKLIPKPHLKLRRIGSRHMIVEASDSCVNLTNVYSLNGTAARLWEAVCKDGCRTPGELAGGAVLDIRCRVRPRPARRGAPVGGMGEDGAACPAAHR